MNAEAAPPLLAPARVDVLEYQAEHRGYTPTAVEGWQRRGIAVDKIEHGTMVAVTPSEMRALIAAYKEKQSCESPT